MSTRSGEAKAPSRAPLGGFQRRDLGLAAAAETPAPRRAKDQRALAPPSLSTALCYKGRAPQKSASPKTETIEDGGGACATREGAYRFSYGRSVRQAILRRKHR